MTDFDLYVQWTVAGLVALVMLWRKQMTLFHPSAVYLAFHVIVFCLRPTMVHYYDFDFVFHYMKLAPRPANLELALFVSSVGLIVFVVAFSVATFHATPLEFGEKRELNDTDRRAFLVTAAIFGPAGLASVIFARPEGEMVNGVFIMKGTSGYLNDLQNVLIPICILLVLVARWRWWSYLPFIAYVVYRLTQGWGRWTFMLSGFLLVLVWLWDHRRRFPPLWSLAAAPVVLLLFMNLTQDRMFFQHWLAGEKSENVERANASRDWRTKWDTLDFANFDYLTFVVTHVPRNTKSFTYGTQYLQLFTEPIPRALWKDKPVGAPVKLVDLQDDRYGNFTGLTVSLVGDGWLSGGWTGVAITMALAGLALGFGYRWFTHNQEVAHKAGAFLIVNAMCVQLFRDGGISIFKFLLFALAPLFVWSFFARRFQIEADVGGQREALRAARMERADAALGIVRPEPAPDDEEDEEFCDEDETYEDDTGEEEPLDDEFDEDESATSDNDDEARDDIPPSGGRRNRPDDPA